MLNKRCRWHLNYTLRFERKRRRNHSVRFSFTIVITHLKVISIFIFSSRFETEHEEERASLLECLSSFPLSWNHCNFSKMGTSLILIYLLHKISFDSIYSFLEISSSRENLFSRQVMKLILICSRIGKRVDENINLRGVWGKTMPINCGPLKEKIKLFVLENEWARIESLHWYCFEMQFMLSLSVIAQ